MKKALIALLVASPLAACVAPVRSLPPPAPGIAPVPVPAVEAPAPVAGFGGLEERKPDACHAKDYTSAMGQPGSAIPTLGVTRDYRVVEYRGIEPQEYDPLRIVFRLDQSGTVYQIDCG